MYQKFYHLSRAPFQLTVDPDFFWSGAKYEKALEAMCYGLEHGGGLTLLTGDAGVGKTAVVHALFRRLEDQRILTAMIPDPCLTELEFFNLVLAALGVGARVEDRKDFHGRLLAFLEQAGGRGRRILLVIDEAQRLTDEVIREIDAMLDLGPGPAGGLSICLVGQINDPRALMDLVGGAFTDRVMVSCHLSPLTAEESATYIRHRLQVAGAESDIFTDDALAEVHRFAEGYPGLINGLCDFALFSAYNRELNQVTAEVVRSSGASLRLAEGGQGGVGGREARPGSGPPGSDASGEDAPGMECAAGERILDASVPEDDASSGEGADGAGADGRSAPARQGRFAVISSFGAMAVLVLLAGGFLYYRQPTDSGWIRPLEPPSAGLPSAPQDKQLAEKGPAPGPEPATAVQDVLATGLAGEASPEQMDTGSDEGRSAALSPAGESGRVPAKTTDVGPLPAVGPGAAADAVAESVAPEKEDALVPAQTAGETAEPVATLVRDREETAAAPGTVDAENEAGGETVTPPAGPAGPRHNVASAGPEQEPSPEAVNRTEKDVNLPPSLKALLAGGSLAGEAPVQRLPDVHINAIPHRSPGMEHDRADTGSDPGKVIDWLLKEKHRSAPSR